MLPLVLEDRVGTVCNQCRNPIAQTIGVVKPSLLSNETSMVVTAHNGYTYRHDKATFTLRRMPEYKNKVDKSVCIGSAGIGILLSIS